MEAVLVKRFYKLLNKQEWLQVKWTMNAHGNWYPQNDPAETTSIRYVKKRSVDTYVKYNINDRTLIRAAGAIEDCRGKQLRKTSFHQRLI